MTPVASNRVSRSRVQGSEPTETYAATVEALPTASSAFSVKASHSGPCSSRTNGWPGTGTA